MDREVWWDTVHGVSKSRTQLKRFSSSSSSSVHLLIPYSQFMVPSFPFAYQVFFSVCESFSVLYVDSYVLFCRFHI